MLAVFFINPFFLSSSTWHYTEISAQNFLSSNPTASTVQESRLLLLRFFVFHSALLLILQHTSGYAVAPRLASSSFSFLIALSTFSPFHYFSRSSSSTTADTSIQKTRCSSTRRSAEEIRLSLLQRDVISFESRWKKTSQVCLILLDKTNFPTSAVLKICISEFAMKLEEKRSFNFMMEKYYSSPTQLA